MSSVQDEVLRVERSFPAGPEEVFDAWTNPEVLRRWWRADPGWRVPVADVDLRVGGGYTLSMEDPATGAQHTVTGSYLEVDRPARLVYSWSWVLEDGSRGPASTVAVEFRGEAERTTVVLLHSGLPDEGSRERHGVGWAACLDTLGTTVFGGTG